MKSFRNKDVVKVSILYQMYFVVGVFGHYRKIFWWLPNKTRKLSHLVFCVYNVHTRSHVNYTEHLHRFSIQKIFCALRKNIQKKPGSKADKN